MPYLYYFANCINKERRILQDNTAIKKAVSYLKDIKDIVPFI